MSSFRSKAAHTIAPEEKKGDKFQIAMAIFTVMAGIGLILFVHWEPTPESWILWFFARIFAETARFIIVARSPLYILYLNLFRWMGYPASVIVEYIVTTLFLSTALVILFKRYMGWFWASFAVFLWLPFFQFAEPPVQNLALALSCLAIAARDRENSRFRMAVFYGLLGLAYILRPTYIIFILIYAIYDMIKIFRQKRLRAFFTTIRPKRYDWPLFTVLILIVWFSIMQSPHRWNNTGACTPTWLPFNAKSVADSAFIHHYNAVYTLRKYGGYEGKDIYFTNQELFNGAESMLGAIRANPRFVAAQLVRNIRGVIGLPVNFTMLPYIYKPLIFLGPFYYTMVLLLMVSLISFVLYGVFRACNSKAILLFFIGHILVIGTTLLSFPKDRHMQSVVPILILGAFWWAYKVSNVLREKQVSSRATKGLFTPLESPAFQGRDGRKRNRWLLTGFTISSYLAIPIFLIFFSNGPLIPNWQTTIRDIIRDVRRGEIRVMERRPFSLKASFKSIRPLVQNCRGVLTLEGRFFGAFLDIPENRIYDIEEIPPFGHLGKSDYEGLNPGRIDCVMVSHTLATEHGFTPSLRIRYQNYIKPYLEELKDKGAKVYDIERYGQVIVLPESKTDHRKRRP